MANRDGSDNQRFRPKSTWGASGMRMFNVETGAENQIVKCFIASNNPFPYLWVTKLEQK